MRFISECPQEAERGSAMSPYSHRHKRARWERSARSEAEEAKLC
jgi:hypothetical protein